METTANLDFQEFLAKKVLRDKKERQERREQLVTLEQRVTKVRKVKMLRMVLLENPGKGVIRVNQEKMLIMDPKVQLAKRVILERRAE